MNESDIAPDAPAAPAAEPAPEQPEAEAPENVNKAIVEANQANAPDPVPVLTQQPSGTPALEAEEVAEEAPVALEDAARVVVIFVEAHRTIGDADLAAAIADVKAALDA
jgi:hypothetical protein